MTKLIPIKVTTLILEEPSTRAINAAMSVPSMEGDNKANTGRRIFPKYVWLSFLFLSVLFCPS